MSFTLLIVDDEPSIRDGLSRYLEDEPIRILLAKNGNEGLQLIQLSKPDLVFLDLGMPEMSGVEVVQHMHVLNIPFPEIVVMTAYDTDLNRELIQMDNRHNIRIMRKPVDPDKALSIVQDAIKRKSNA